MTNKKSVENYQEFIQILFKLINFSKKYVPILKDYLYKSLKDVSLVVAFYDDFTNE